MQIDQLQKRIKRIWPDLEIVQIEINQGLYMEPEGIRLIPERVARVTINMKEVFEDLAALLSP